MSSKTEHKPKGIKPYFRLYQFGGKWHFFAADVNNNAVYDSMTGNPYGYASKGEATRKAEAHLSKWANRQDKEHGTTTT